MTNSKATAALLFCLSLSLPAVSQAQIFTEGTRSAGMGEAYTAVATGGGGLYHNPAGIARTVMYAVDATFEYSPLGSTLNATVVDSKTNPAISAGAGYSYFFGRDENEGVTGHDIRLGLALPVVPDRISIGVGGRYLILDADDVELINGFTLDAGVLAKVAEGLHVGIAGKNLIDQCDRLGCESVAPTTVAAGLAFGSDIGLILSGDVGFDLTTDPDAVQPEYSIGAEYLAVVVPLRAGFNRIEATDQSLLTFGAGWRSRSAGFDLGYQLDLADTDDMYFLGSFSVYL